jgi:hypothetical protein
MNSNNDTLELDIKKKYINVKVEGKDYKILALSSTPIHSVEKIKTDAETLEYFKSIIPKELYDTLTASAFNELLEYWSKKSDIDPKVSAVLQKN